MSFLVQSAWLVNFVTAVRPLLVFCIPTSNVVSVHCPDSFDCAELMTLRVVYVDRNE